MAQARKGTRQGHIAILITKSPAPGHTLSSLTGPSLAVLLLLIALGTGSRGECSREALVSASFTPGESLWFEATRWDNGETSGFRDP